MTPLIIKRIELCSRITQLNDSIARIRFNMIGLQLEFKTIRRLQAQVRELRVELKNYPLDWKD